MSGDLNFRDRVVLVSGAAQGIGRAIATRFANAGAQVHLTDVDEKGLQATANDLRAPSYSADISKRDSAHEVVRAVTNNAGRIDCLALAAGGVRGQIGKPVEDISEADWKVIFDANLASAMWMCQAAAPGMKRIQSGRIITISSGAGLRPSLTGIQAYAAAKHGLVGLTKQLSWELGPHGITVNSVAPGFVLSNPTTERQWESYGAEGQERFIESVHMRRIGSADDVAHAVMFFASDGAGWITGQVLSVDGGRS
jgi:3-oxoacyl-[acyl-carrier protein] reductase